MTVEMEMEDRELTHRDRRFVALLEQFWYVHARLPTQEELAKDDIDPTYYGQCMKNKRFRKLLSELGIVDDPDDLRLVSWQLSDIQLAAANTMLDLLDGRSARKKLQDLEISTSTWQAWLRDPEFKEYLRVRSENLLKDNIHDVHAALLDRARAGDVNAIKFFYELTGRYVPQMAKGQMDPMEMVVRVIEVVQKHVKDESALKAIGSSLMGHQTVSDQTASNQVIQGELEPSPPVAKPPVGFLAGELGDLLNNEVYNSDGS